MGRNIKKTLPGIAAFIFTAAFMVTAMAVTGIYPWGTRSYLSIDGMHQYLPFLTELHHKIRSGESLYFTWHAGLGMDFYSIFSYYLASPLNLLLLLFSTDDLNEAVTLLIVLKTALASFTMALMMRISSSEGGIRPALAAFLCGVSYGLSAYVVGYHVNLMWMDAVYLLPLVATGLDRIIRKPSHFLLYGITLFLTILCNFTIGFMVCIFSLIYFFAEIRNIRESLRNVASFFLTSLWAGLMNGVLILPTLLQIRTTRASGTLSLAGGGSIITNPLHTIRAMLPGSRYVMTSALDSDVNLYCGIFMVLFAIIYLLDRRNERRERAGMFILALVLFLSCFVTPVSRIFNGFHQGYGFPNRQSFLLIFVMIMLSGRELMHLLTRRNIYTLVTALVLTVFGATDVATAAFVSIRANGSTDRSQEAARISYVRQQISRDPGTYRADFDQGRLYNEGMLAGENAVSAFTSTIPETTVKMLHSLGFYTSLNTVSFTGSTEFTRWLLGVKYSENLARLANLNPYSTVRDSDIMQQDQVTPSLAVTISHEQYRALKKVKMDSVNPFENQNILARALAGTDIYKTTAYKVSKNQDFTIPVSEGETLDLCIRDDSLDTGGQSSITDGALHELQINGEPFSHYLTRIYENVSPVEGVITLRADADITVYAAAVDQTALRKVQNSVDISDTPDIKLNDRGFRLDSVKSGDHVLVSVPWNSSFALYESGADAADTGGPETKLEELAGFTCVTSKGSSTGYTAADVRYTPRGIVPGAVISLSGLVLFILMMIRTGVLHDHPMLTGKHRA